MFDLNFCCVLPLAYLLCLLLQPGVQCGEPVSPSLLQGLVGGAGLMKLRL